MDVFNMNFLVMNDPNSPIFFYLETKTGHVIVKDLGGDDLEDAEEYIVDLQDRVGDMMIKFQELHAANPGPPKDE